MARFGFESPSIHGIDRVTAWGCEQSYPPQSGRGRLSLTVLNDKGESVELELYFEKGTSAYVWDLAQAINRVAEEHGRLTDDERRDLVLEMERAA
jgi:hypothetical protein